MTLDVDAVSEATRSAYELALARFSRWLAGAGWGTGGEFLNRQPTSPRPPRVVLEYLTDMSNQRDEEGAWRYSGASIRQAMAAIDWDHARALLDPPGSDPALRLAMRRIQAERKDGPAYRPLELEDLKRILAGFREDPNAATRKASRDRCLILFTFAGGFLVQETSGMRVGDVSWDQEGGLLVRVRQNAVKTRRDRGRGHRPQAEAAIHDRP